MSRPIERILMTGAAGGLGKAMRERFTGRFGLLRLSDITPMEPAGPGEEVVTADLADAAQQLADEGLRVAVKYVPASEPRGRVIGQSRPPGSELQRGEAVSLNVSTGPSPPANVTVPDATEQTEVDGRAALEQVGFEVLTIKIPAVTDDIVVSHSPPANDRIPRGSLVILYAGG